MQNRSEQRADAIRVVPLKVPAAKPAVAAKLTYRGGPVLGSVEVTTIFWGAWWKQAPQRDTVPKLDAFFDAILVSSLMDQLREYGVTGTAIGHGKRVATLTVDQAPKSSVDDTDITAKGC